MICTKTYYNYIEFGLIDIKNIDLPLKVRWKNSSKKVKQNKKVLARSIDEKPRFIENCSSFGHWEIDTFSTSFMQGVYHFGLLAKNV